MLYLAVAYQGDYGPTQILASAGGQPKQEPPYPENLGAFRAEPIIWIGYATVDDLSVPQPLVLGHKNWYKAYTPVIIGCEHCEVNHTIQFNYTRDAQSFDIKRRDYLRKVVNTTYITKKDPDKQLTDGTRAIPESNYILPTNVKEYRRVPAYHSIGSGLRLYLNGTITMPNFLANTDVIYTSLINRKNYLPIKDFRKGVQKAYEDMIISMFAEPNFSAVSWAADGKPCGKAKGGLSTAYPCQRQRITTFFYYNMTQPLSVYTISIFLTVVGVSFGLQAYREEGAMRNMKPSSIIEASRASNLHALGAQGRTVKIGYGFVQQQAGGSVRSFGIE
ncbi:hypothetical protein ACHAPQ_005309 [Fusarium lateritium]